MPLFVAVFSVFIVAVIVAFLVGRSAELTFAELLLLLLLLLEVFLCYVVRLIAICWWLFVVTHTHIESVT